MAHDKKVKFQRISRMVLGGADAEFLLQECKRGKFNIRVGRIWAIHRPHGTSTLLLDYDGCQSYNTKALKQRLSIAGIQPLTIIKRKSPSGSGLHIAITVRGTLDPFAIVALQCLCESDPIREAQNFRRALCMSKKQWLATGNVLFQKGKK